MTRPKTSPSHNYTLDFNDPGGSNQSPITVLAPTVAAAGESLPTPAAPAGEVFDGWVTAAGTLITNGTELAGVLAVGPSTTTLTAVYGPADVTINVTNDVNGVGCSGGDIGGGAITCSTIAEAISYVESDTFFANHSVTIFADAGPVDGSFIVSLPANVVGLTIQGLGDASTTLSASGVGGSVFDVTAGNVTISDMTITGGTGTGTFSSGGGVFVQNGATVTLTNDTISGNTADSGGGVENDMGTVTISDSLLQNDTASLKGGAVTNVLGTTNLVNDTFVDDTADSGGTLAGGGGGGAVWTGDGTTTMSFDTLYDDSSPAGGAIAGQDLLTGGTTVADSILDAAGCNPAYDTQYTARITDGGYNVESDDSCGFGSTSVVNSPNINLGSSPGPGATNGAFVEGILGNSPAALLVPLSACSVATDAEGDARPAAGAPACDAGAVNASSNYPPSAPPVQSAFGGAGQATVSWSVPGFNGRGTVESYTVTATDQTTPGNGGETCTVASPALSCVVPDLTDGDEYTFTVTADNGYVSVPSAPSLAVVPAAPPGSPTVTSVVETGDPQATVSWTPPASDGGVPIIAYVVTATDLINAANGGQQCSTLATDPDTCTVEGLVVGDQYTFSVVAINGALGSPPPAGDSGFPPGSVTVSPSTSAPLTVDPTTPGAPTFSQVTPGPNEITVAWVAGDDGGLPITGYTVKAVDGTNAANGGQECEAPADGTTCTLQQLTAGDSYYVTIVAENSLGTGDPATTASPVVPTGLPIPSVVLGGLPGSVTVGNPVTATATVSGGDSPSGSVTFDVFSNQAGTGTPLFTSVVPLADGSASSAPFTPPATGTLYWFATYGGDANNAAASATPVSVVVTPAPSTVTVTAPSGATATVPTSGLSATVTGAGVTSGTVTFYVFGPSATPPTSCPGAVPATGTATVTAAGSYLLAYTPAVAGTYYLYASYSGDSSSLGSASSCGSAMTSFAVGYHGQTVAITSTAPLSPSYLSTYSVVAAGDPTSGNAVTVTAGPASVCTITGVTVTFVGVGNCAISATQAASAAYSQGVSPTQVVSVVGTSTLGTGGRCTNQFLTGKITGNVTIPAGGACDITAGATINGNVTDSSTLTLAGGTVNGNVFTTAPHGSAGATVVGPVTVTGAAVVKGNLMATAASLTVTGWGAGVDIMGNLQAMGGGVVTITDAVIGGNLQVQQQAASSTPSEVCATTVDGNLQWQNDPDPVIIGDPTSCGADTIEGNLQVHGDTVAATTIAAVIVDGDRVGGNVQVHQVTAPAGAVPSQVEDTTIGGNLLLQQVAPTPTVVGDSTRVARGSGVAGH